MRSARRALLVFLLPWASGLGCTGGDSGVPDAGGTTVAACAWGSSFPELDLPTSEVKGVLKGASRNGSTTCTRQKGTGGPETIYLLRLKERSIVDLEVVSTMDTVVAVRTVCDDPLTEVACNDTPPLSATAGPNVGTGAPGSQPVPFPVDAAVPAPPVSGSGRDGHVRTALDPGTYFVVIDEAEPFGVGGAFTLKVRTVPPPAHASCRTPVPVMDGTHLAAEQLDLAGDKPPACGGGETRPALFYGVKIPSGQRLTVRAQATAGDRPWMPVLHLFTTCTQEMCLATDRDSPQGDRILRYVNNGPTAEDVILSVSASAPVSGASFRLDVSIGDPIQNATCQTARELSDGLVLRNQDLSEGQPSHNMQCKPPGGPALFYRATLLPQQTLNLTAIPRTTAPEFPRAPLFMVLYESCGGEQTVCQPGQERLTYFNSGPGMKTVFVEVSTFPGAPPTIFDLMVSMPLPPGGIAVRPTSGLRTTEAGGEDSFEVVLTSPPKAAVIIPLESSDPAEGTVSPASLRFELGNWDKPQKVTVKGVDDNRKDGNRTYTILVKPAMSEDPRYAGVDGPDVTVVNQDDEPGFTFEGQFPLVTSESGAQATFTVVLNRKPAADVRLPLRSSNEGEGKVSPAELVFSPANWDQPQRVTVTGVDDDVRDGVQTYKVVTGAALSDDPEYAGIDPEDLEARNTDNEFERLAPRPVGGDLPCSTSGMGRRIAVDEAATLYVGMSCLGSSSGGSGAGGSGGSAGSSAGSVSRPGVRDDSITFEPAAFVAVSLDGGRTFAAPRDVGIPGAFEVSIVGGPPGVAYLIAAGPRGVFFTRTGDSGATWQPAVTLVPEGLGGVRLDAAGKRVLVLANHREGPILWRSDDGGGDTFERTALASIGGRPVEIAVERGGSGAVWLVTYDGRPVLHKSADGGATFGRGQVIPGDVLPESIAIGSKTFFGAGKDTQLLVAPLDDLANVRLVPGLSPMLSFPRVLVADPWNNVTVLDNSFGMLDLRRLASGADALSPARSLGPVEGLPSGVALADNAVAITLAQQGRVMVAIETWP
jgi:hypothetical protein